MLEQPTTHGDGDVGGSSSPRIRHRAVLGERIRLEALVAQGGTSVIYRGRDLLLGRPVAVKVPLAHLDAAGLDRFRHQARAIAGLAHTNLAACYDLGEVDGLPYLLMEYVEGESLAHILGGNAVDRVEDGIDWAMQVCRGLDHLHLHSIVHGDIKPQHLLLTPRGRIKIIDFGLTRAPGGAEGVTPGHVLGTPLYLAPEVAAGEPASTGSDLYSLGVVLYRLFTGRLPFEGADPRSLAMQHRGARVAPPGDIRPGLAPALAGILLRLLEKDPLDRYPSAAGLADALAIVPPAPRSV